MKFNNPATTSHYVSWSTDHYKLVETYAYRSFQLQEPFPDSIINGISSLDRGLVSGSIRNWTQVRSGNKVKAI
jgi:hypothetical protein